MNSKKYLSIVSHYEECLDKHGDNYKGVDWPKDNDALLRYKVMLEILRPKDKAHFITLLDFGCGLSHLFQYMLDNGFDNIKYSGLDISQKFISFCKKKFPNNNYFSLDILDDPDLVPVFDYVVMNGILTEKCGLSFDDMWDYTKKLLSAVFKKVKTGMVFNVMSKDVDWERDDLFHLSVDTLGDFLSKNISRHFVVRHDYGLYEYTVYVYRDSSI